MEFPPQLRGRSYAVRSMSILRRTLLIALLVTQAIFMAAGSSLVRCVEASSTTQFELLSGACCEDSNGTPEVSEHAEPHADSGDTCGECQSQEDCSGCDDQPLTFAALERHDCPVPAPLPAPGFWDVDELFAAVLTDGAQVSFGESRFSPRLGLLNRGVLAGVVVRC